MNSVATARRVSIRRVLLVILFSRTVIDTAYRAVYPFLPFIAADLGVSVESAARIIQARNLVGLTAPLFGPLSDRYGRRALMLVGAGVLIVGSLSLFFFSPLVLVGGAMVLLGLVTTIFIPAQQAYFADSIPYAERGRAMALAELAWSASAIIGLPLFGLIVQLAGWRMGFVGIAILGVVSFALIRYVLPRTSHHSHEAHRGWIKSVGQAVRAPGALAAITVTFLLATTNENINIIFGAWMKDTFLLDAVALGLVAAAIGGAELASELFAAGFVDRIGKWRTVGGSLLLGAAAYALLPFLAVSGLAGTVGLVMAYFMFELAIVSALPLVSELAPGARATLISIQVAAFSLGRALGAFSGPALLSKYGFTMTSLVSSFGILVAFGLWMILVRERHTA